MRRTSSLFAAFLFAAAPVAGTLGADVPEMGAAVAGDASTTVGTVEAIDIDQRQITFKTTDGKMVVFHAGPEVRNFDRVRKGDLLVLDYYDGLALALGPKDLGIRERTEKVEATGAPKGEKPALTVTSSIDIEATVQAVDKKNRLVTVRGPLNTLVLKVSDAVDMDNVKVGDVVYARYVEAYVVAIEPPADASGEVQIETTSIAIGIGVTWGHGTLTLRDGTKKKFKIDGLSLVDLGVSSVKADGYVYGLKSVGEFAGNYYGAKAGIALGGGGGDTVLKNGKGVTMYLSGHQSGLKFALAAGGARISLAD